MTVEAGDGAAPGDEQLMTRLQAGDVDALGALYDRYGDRAYRVARSECRDDAGAEEAVQDAFASIWRSQATYRPQQGTAAAWLLTVVRHRAIALARRDEAGAPGGEGHLQDLLARLPDAQREAITLAYHGRLTHTEIAQQLRLPPGTVKGRIRLGLHKLRQDMEHTGA